jgi:NAD(P)-dependent dehydrogenase (short-subunit alcohol dehydrogenase family)
MHPNLKFVTIQADVGVKVECERLVAETISELGGLDVIVSNAGTKPSTSWLIHKAGQSSIPLKISIFRKKDGYMVSLTKADGQDKCFAINVKAHVWLLKAALPTFKKNAEGGHLLITGSITVSCDVGVGQTDRLGTRRWWQFNGTCKFVLPLMVGVCSHKSRPGASHALYGKISGSESQVRLLLLVF